jgi:hypothetical protein
LLVTILGMTGANPCLPQDIPDGLYLGQEPPGLTPEVFAPDIISLPDRYEYSVVFSPDLDECVFGVTNMFWSVFTLMFTEMAADSSWSDPVEAPFLGTGDGLMAEYSHGGDRINFASSRPIYPPGNLWQASRNMDGWDEPVIIPEPVSSSSDEWGPSFTSDNVLYFVSYRPGGVGDGDIYRSVPVQGEYPSVENLGPPINTPFNDGSPFIADDESYMVFESFRPGGYGQGDLYISYRDGDTWGEPENLGSIVNTDQIEDDPFISPDGKYLFFNRRRSFVTTEQTDLYWVDARVVFEPTSVEGDDGPWTPRGSLLDQNHPNPFRPSTTISYTLSSGGVVAIKIHDIRGGEVRSLVNRYQRAGTHSVLLRAAPRDGLASGVYYYSLLVDGEPLMTRRMLLLR